MSGWVAGAQGGRGEVHANVRGRRPHEVELGYGVRVMLRVRVRVKGER